MTHFPERELDTFAAITERDVDLVLVIALRASAGCRALFAEAAGVELRELISVQHSVPTRDGREADIVMRLGRPERQVVLEIENKLGAAFQPAQPEAYAQRAAMLQGTVNGHSARAVLVAPKQYLEAAGTRAALFHGSVAYEDVRDTVSSESDWGRSVALLLEHAILQHRRGRREGPDDEHRTLFFNVFADLGVSEGLPQLPSKARKAGAGFLWYPLHGTLTQPTGWRPGHHVHGAWLVAKLTLGYADIELIGMRPLVDVERLRATTPSGAQPALHVEKDTVRLRTLATVLEPARPLVEQFNEVADFIERLGWLQYWWEDEGRRWIEAAMVVPGAEHTE